MPSLSICRSASLVILLIILAGCGGHRSATRIATSPSHTPAYPPGKGPVVLWDLGHHNFGSVKAHEALRAWVSRDGYVVRPSEGQFEKASLSEADIVVIRLALAAENDTHGLEPLEATKWVLPTPSAFLPPEIHALVNWVRAGGALLVISEHMPFGGAVADLASAFGIEVSNSFTVDTTVITHLSSESLDAYYLMFRRRDGTLSSHPITEGRTEAERVDSVMAEAGCALRLPPKGQSLLTLGSSAMALLPEVSWKFPANTPRQPIGGWSQGGVMQFGRGRLAIMCEGFLVTAPSSIEPGTLDEKGLQHPQFTLNLFHWLSGLLPTDETATTDTRQSGPIVLDVTCEDTTEIYTVDERGSDLRRLTNLAPQHAFAAHPAWSPDGSAIAFTVISHAGNRHRSEIYVMSPDGGDLRPLTQTPGGRSSWNASWAPDGRHVAFASDRDGNHDVYSMRSDGEGVERLTVTQGNERHSWNPDWSPDGRRIAFDSNRNGYDEIYVLDLASRRVHAIGSTPPGKGSWTPAWSPDARQIAFASNRHGDDELYVMNADGSGVRRINVRATGRPRWSPHGKALIFQRFETPEREAVWTVAVDGAAPTRLLGDDRCSVRHPDWWGR